MKILNFVSKPATAFLFFPLLSCPAAFSANNHFNQTDSIAKQTDSISNEKLSEVIITSQRSNPTQGVLAPVQIFKRGKIESSSSNTLESAMKAAQSVDLRERGSLGMQADISVYGGTPDQTAVLLNGVNFTDARTGHQSHSLPIDLESVSGIDVITGVPDLGAYAGAVNIITVPEFSNYLRTGFEGGAHGYMYGNFSGAITGKNATAFVAGSLRRSDGYIENTDFDNYNLFTRVRYDAGNAGTFDFQAGGQRRFFGANDFYSLDYPNQAETTRTYLGSIKWNYDVAKLFKIEAIAGYRKNYDKFELFRDSKDAASWYTGPNWHDTDNIIFNAKAVKQWKFGITSSGFDWTSNHIYSNVLGEDLDSPKKVAGERDTYYTKGAKRNVTSEWIRQSYNALDGKLLLSATATLSQSPYGGVFLWGAAADWKALNSLTVNLSAIKSMRLPTYTDLYYTTATHVANSNLSPEKAITYRASVNYNTKIFNCTDDLQITFSIFHRRGKHIIDWVKEESSGLWESLQITKLNTTGEELGAKYSSAGFLKSVAVSYCHTDANRNTNGYTSKSAFDYLKDKVTAAAEIIPLKRLNISIAGIWSSRNGGYFNTSGNYVTYKSFLKVDGAASYSLLNEKRFSAAVNLRVSNIFNIKYCDCGGIRMPGTWLTAGISFLIK